jgi:glycogen debranching enzyme
LFHFTTQQNGGSHHEAARFLTETEIELVFRDQHSQEEHWRKVHAGVQPRKLKLVEVMQEIVQAHAHGIKFREWNAGPKIDQEMRDEGFNVNIWLDRQTGFLHGGNQYNCGTWMDKMGSSDKTGNKGIPATPRDGAPIEITAMLYTALRFLEELHSMGIISNEGVTIPAEVRGHDHNFWSYKEWADLIKDNFERCYWVPKDPQ